MVLDVVMYGGSRLRGIDERGHSVAIRGGASRCLRIFLSVLLASGISVLFECRVRYGGCASRCHRSVSSSFSVLFLVEERVRFH